MSRRRPPALGSHCFANGGEFIGYGLSCPFIGVYENVMKRVFFAVCPDKVDEGFMHQFDVVSG